MNLTAIRLNFTSTRKFFWRSGNYYLVRLAFKKHKVSFPYFEIRQFICKVLKLKSGNHKSYSALCINKIGI